MIYIQWLPYIYIITYCFRCVSSSFSTELQMLPNYNDISNIISNPTSDYDHSKFGSIISIFKETKNNNNEETLKNFIFNFNQRSYLFTNQVQNICLELMSSLNSEKNRLIENEIERNSNALINDPINAFNHKVCAFYSFKLSLQNNYIIIPNANYYATMSEFIRELKSKLERKCDVTMLFVFKSIHQRLSVLIELTEKMDFIINHLIKAKIEELNMFPDEYSINNLISFFNYQLNQLENVLTYLKMPYPQSVKQNEETILLLNAYKEIENTHINIEEDINDFKYNQTIFIFKQKIQRMFFVSIFTTMYNSTTLIINAFIEYVYHCLTYYIIGVILFLIIIRLFRRWICVVK